MTYENSLPRGRMCDRTFDESALSTLDPITYRIRPTRLADRLGRESALAQLWAEPAPRNPADFTEIRSKLAASMSPRLSLDFGAFSAGFSWFPRSSVWRRSIRLHAPLLYRYSWQPSGLPFRLCRNCLSPLMINSRDFLCARFLLCWKELKYLRERQC